MEGGLNIGLSLGTRTHSAESRFRHPLGGGFWISPRPVARSLLPPGHRRRVRAQDVFSRSLDGRSLAVPCREYKPYTTRTPTNNKQCRSTSPTFLLIPVRWKVARIQGRVQRRFHRWAVSFIAVPHWICRRLGGRKFDGFRFRLLISFCERARLWFGVFPPRARAPRDRTPVDDVDVVLHAIVDHSPSTGTLDTSTGSCDAWRPRASEYNFSAVVPSRAPASSKTCRL